MSFETSGTWVMLALLVPAVLVVAVARMPRWYARSVCKHALWRLRDDVVDAKLAGRLPADHPAVTELVERVEWAIEESRSFDLLHLWVWNRAFRGLPADTARKLKQVPNLVSLDGAQRTLVEGYRVRYNRVAVTAILLSSWVGIALVLRFGLPLSFKVLRHHARNITLGGLARKAADEAAAETKIGRSARDYITVEGPREGDPILV